MNHIAQFPPLKCYKSHASRCVWKGSKKSVSWFEFCLSNSIIVTEKNLTLFNDS